MFNKGYRPSGSAFENFLFTVSSLRANADIIVETQGVNENKQRKKNNDHDAQFYKKQT